MDLRSQLHARNWSLSPLSAASFVGFRFCILLVPHCAVVLRPEPLGRVQHRQHIRVWRPLQISLMAWGKTYSSIPRFQTLNGALIWPPDASDANRCRFWVGNELKTSAGLRPNFTGKPFNYTYLCRQTQRGHSQLSSNITKPNFTYQLPSPTFHNISISP